MAGSCIYHSTCGELVLAACEGRLYACDWQANGRWEATERRLRRYLSVPWEPAEASVVREAVSQLDAYFEHRSRRFSLPIAFCGTSFQQEVWQALLALPYGVRCSYADMARRIGRPSSVRAVASAIAANPLSIVVPCHRVLGADGRLAGYAGGGEAKQWLLAWESDEKE